MTILDRLTAEFPILDTQRDALEDALIGMGVDDVADPELRADINRLLLDSAAIAQRWEDVRLKIQQERELRARPIN